MADFPKIQSPCPLRMKALPRAGADFCGQCSRKVHNLNGMDGAQRRAFMAGCGDSKVCVAYTVAMPRARAAALGLGVGLAAALVAAPALAADPLAPDLQSPAAESTTPAMTRTVTKYCPDKDAVAATDAAAEDDATELTEILWVGGVDRADEAQWSDVPSLLAELPRAGADAFLDEDGVEFGPAPDAPR